MSYCQRCGERNLPHARYCGSCAAPLPLPKREKLQPGFGYNIHHAECDHGLKLEPLEPGKKLALLGNHKYIYIGNLLMILWEIILLLFNVFRTDNLLWQEFLEQRAGLFGPRGQFFALLYFLLLCGALLTSANPLYTRNTYRPRQLYLPIIAEIFLFPILALPVWFNLYFGDFLGTTLCTGGYLLLSVSAVALILQYILIRKYKKMKKSGIYSYVAN